MKVVIYDKSRCNRIECIECDTGQGHKHEFDVSNAVQAQGKTLYVDRSPDPLISMWIDDEVWE